MARKKPQNEHKKSQNYMKFQNFMGIFAVFMPFACMFV